MNRDPLLFAGQQLHLRPSKRHIKLALSNNNHAHPSSQVTLRRSRGPPSRNRPCVIINNPIGFLFFCSPFSLLFSGASGHADRFAAVIVPSSPVLHFPGGYISYSVPPLPPPHHLVDPRRASRKSLRNPKTIILDRQ